MEKRITYSKFRCSAREKRKLRWQAKVYGYESVSDMARDWLLKGPARFNPNRKPKR